MSGPRARPPVPSDGESGRKVIIRRSPASIQALLAATLVAFGCAESESGFGAFFEETGRVELEEFPDDPIVGIGQVARRPDGGFMLADASAARVRLFDPAGRQVEVLGGRGDGPGEFRSPTAAVELDDGSVIATDGADPTLTIFAPGRDVRLARVPGQYASWIGRLGDAVVVGLGSRGNRFAILEPAGDTIATFGAVRSEVNEVPFWIFFARDRGTVADGRVVINTTFYPTLRVYGPTGDSIRTIGLPPASWIPPRAPPVDRLTEPGDRERIEEWSRSFTVVRGLATAADSFIVVQYGSHDPQPADPYHVVPTTLDVYTPDGEKLAEDLALTLPVVGGGRELLVLSAQPPDPWTITTYRWRGR